MAKRITIELTEFQANQLMWAIELTQNSYDGWTNEDMGADTVRGLKSLELVHEKLWNEFMETGVRID